MVVAALIPISAAVTPYQLSGSQAKRAGAASGLAGAGFCGGQGDGLGGVAGDTEPAGARPAPPLARPATVGVVPVVAHGRLVVAKAGQAPAGGGEPAGRLDGTAQHFAGGARRRELRDGFDDARGRELR